MRLTLNSCSLCGASSVPGKAAVSAKNSQHLQSLTGVNHAQKLWRKNRQPDSRLFFGL